MFLILATSFVPSFELDERKSIIQFSEIIQNLLHIPMFAILSILIFQISKNYYMGNRKASIVTFTLCFTFGLLNELIQTFIPGRFGGLMDIVLNSVGSLIGIIVYLSVEKNKPGSLYRIICE